MADYIYLLENRLTAAQRAALLAIRELAKNKALTLFLVGGAVRDLTSGSPVRDLDVAVQGNVLKLNKDLEKAGAVIVGQNEPGQALFLRFPGNVRMEIASTISVTYPKPGKPVVKSATILDDLRRRDFTANAMALSLNEGSYGLLMDPLNGVADIENRQLRLVSNYGFIEDPVRMIRAARLMARLGWTLDEKTQSRYETGQQEDYISVLSSFHRGYETEEIVHEEDPLRVLKRLEAEGWMKHLAPFWLSAKVNVAELERLRETQTQLQMQGIHPDPAAANFPLLTAKLSSSELDTLKSSFPRKGFVTEIEALEAEAKDFASLLGGKQAAAPSAAWKLITSSSPETVLWTAFSSKSGAIQGKFKSFYTEWPQVRQKIPYTLMQEMRIVKELPGYDELLEKLFFELMDGRLQTVEEMKAFLEPYSPPAPPPPVSTRRLKAAKAPKGRAKKAKVVDDLDEDELDLPAIARAIDSETDESSASGTELDSEAEAGSDSSSGAESSSNIRESNRPTVVNKPVNATKAGSDDSRTAASAPAKSSTPAGKQAALAPASTSSAKTKSVPPAPPAKKAASLPPVKSPAKTPLKLAVKAVPPSRAAKPAVKSAALAVAARKPAAAPAKASAGQAATSSTRLAATAKQLVPAKKSVIVKKAAPIGKQSSKAASVPVKKAPAKAGGRKH